MTFTQLQDRRAGVILAIAGSVIFLGTAGFFGYQYYVSNGTGSFDPAAYYLGMHDALNAGDSLAVSGDHAGAQEVYAEFLENTVDPTEIEQIRLAVARNALAMNIENGVKLYKEFAADELLNPQIRAAALEELGILYVTGVIADGAALTEALFSDEPYASMRAETDEVSYMKLFEYVNTIHPRLLATAYLAEYSSDTTLIAEATTLIAEAPDTNPFKPLALVLVGTAEKRILEDMAIGEGHITSGFSLLESYKTLAEQNSGESFPEPDGKGYLDALYLRTVAGQVSEE